MLALLCGFAWAIGGEKYFGKWRRGILVAIPFLIAGIGLPWWYHIGILALIWPIYQALFYDECIKLIWPDSGEELHPETESGISGLLVNGFLVSLMPALYCFATSKSLSFVLLGVIWFPFICWLSNRWHIKLPGIIKIGGVKIWGGQDSWWLSCFLYGIIVGWCL